MTGRVALCLDEMTCRNPELIGLEGEMLDSQQWLDVYTTGAVARDHLRNDSKVDEAWIVSCDDVEPINLAATLKSDRPTLRVRLVTDDPCGSLFSRAHTAGIDEVIELGAFLRRYVEAKRNLLGQPLTTDLAPQLPVACDNALQTEPNRSESSKAAVVPQSHTIPFQVKPESSQAQRETFPVQPEPPRIQHETSLIQLESSQTQPQSPFVLQDSSQMRPELPQSPDIQTPLLQDSAAAAGSTPLVLDRERQLPAETANCLQLRPQSSLAMVGSASRAFVITVVSGSGGAGKSSVSALTALIAQATGHKTLLLDCDLQFGDVAGMVGAENPLPVDEALARPELLDRELGASRPLAVLAAPARLEAAEQVVPHLSGLMDTLISSYEVIVVNTGASWGEQHAVMLERSSAALFLVDQRVSSIRSCQHALELCARCGIATGPFKFALNKCAKGAPLTSMDVSSVLKGAPVFELKDGGRDVEEYLSAGAAAELLQAKNEFAKSIEHVLGQILPAGSAQAAARAFEMGEGKPARKRGLLFGGKRGR